MEVSLQSFKKRFTYDPQKDLLGKGGFGEVYKAYDTEDHIFVALKISQGTADDKYNLINEIKRFKKLSHPNIVKHIEAYEVNTGSFDIHGKPIAYHVGILEYADNGTLADLLKKGTPDYRHIEDLAKDIIEGLAYLHSENIIHRDLKPTNILLFSEGEKLRAKITDFGIAKHTDATAASTQLVGTVEYMAPEFFSTGNITPSADVWSVGVMLLEALTGTHPFGKTTQGLSNEQIINNILNKDLSTATQNLRTPFKEIITRCLLRETNIRPQSANELKGLLQLDRDAFSERTQVIEIKNAKGIAQKTNWKNRGAALFDFDLIKVGRKKLIAREFAIGIVGLVLIIVSPFLVKLTWNNYCNFRITNTISRIDTLQVRIDSFETIEPKLKESRKSFSSSYFRWSQGDDIFLTPLGVIYDEIKSYRISYLTLFEIDLSRDMYFGDLCVHLFALGNSNPLKLNKLEQELKNSLKQPNYNIVTEITSSMNLSLSMPTVTNNNINFYDLFILKEKIEADWLPNEIAKQIMNDNWAKWFYENRIKTSQGILSISFKNFEDFKTRFTKRQMLSSEDSINIASIDSLKKLKSKLDDKTDALFQSKIYFKFEDERTESEKKDDGIYAEKLTEENKYKVDQIKVYANYNGREGTENTKGYTLSGFYSISTFWVFLILFGIRYLVYGLKWSLRELKEKP